MYRKLKNGQFYNSETRTFINYNPFLEGQTILTSNGFQNMYEYKDFINLKDGARGVISAYCLGIETRKNTTFANFFDFEYISNGKRPIKNQWTDFVHDFEPDKVYMLEVEKNILYPASIIIKKKFVIKK